MYHTFFFVPVHKVLPTCCHKLFWPAREVDLVDKDHDKRGNLEEVGAGDKAGIASHILVGLNDN